MNFGSSEGFHCQGLNVSNVMSLKFTVKYIFKDGCNKFKSCAFIKILRRVPSSGILIYPTLSAAKLTSPS